MTTRNAIVLALTAVCAAVGGLIGLQLWDLDFWRSVAVVVVGVLLGVLLAFGVLTTDRRPVTRTHHETVAEREPVFARAASSPEPETTPANRTWWTEAPEPPATTTATRPHEPPRQGYDVDRAVVAQCPRCGDFRLDLKQDGDSCAFHCRNPNCGHRWKWRAGTPWPTTVVRRNLTG
jgi:hypothetical protein